ncbi:hypothetical protein, partial [Dyadobacter sp. BHUBP1]|uniref:hypothetical protein n=1 Tax=Dyadobacter sp. BHUBP1 TaxID=3424178 RepID=UPI003D342CD1
MRSVSAKSLWWYPWHFRCVIDHFDCSTPASNLGFKEDTGTIDVLNCILRVDTISEGNGSLVPETSSNYSIKKGLSVLIKT